jgi:tRNA (guanine37-N1)-methyltransferase
MLHFHIITLFSESIEPYFKSSIIGRALQARKIKISYYDPKDFTRDPGETGKPSHGAGKYGRVDWKPYGGGPGMVLRPEPILKAVQKAKGKRKANIFFFSTDGAQFDEPTAKKLSKGENIILICGHYEGIDERVAKILRAKKISVGPYVLTGGELPAATFIDAISRFVPGVLGKAESLEASRISSPEVYTRPEILVWKGRKYKVPKVLLSGHHAKINEWKAKRTK